MSTVVYFPVSKKNRTRSRIAKPKEPQTTISYSQSARIAHELKNCMTVLLLRSACSEGGVDQATDSRAHGQTLEEVVAEMDRLVDEFVRLVENGSGVEGGPATDM
jgi:hypothetical protein